MPAHRFAERPRSEGGVERSPARAAPAGDPATTFISARRRAQTEEARVAYARLFLVGTVAWPAFAAHDVFASLLAGRPHALVWVLTWRALGECAAVPLYLFVRSGRASVRQMMLVDYALFVLGGALLALMAIELGGLASPYTQGVIIFVFARCTVFPLPWRKAIPVPAACVAAYPIVLAIASLFLPELRAQWHDRASLAVLLDNQLFVVAGTAVAVFGSHVIDHAQRQVREARQLGSYRLKARIGRGASGDVWLARQVPLERDVALKVLRDQAWRGEEAVRRFAREARAASQLEHANTIRIFDFGASDDGVLFIAMELLTGMDADALVETAGRLPAARVIHLARQACGSLAEAHERGILHRDIKPANLFVATVGEDFDVVKVLDFGVARFGGAAQTQTEEGTLFGTPDYMAPEVCGGERADARGDVYAIGASMYFMLTGTALFPERSVTEVIMMHISTQPEPPSVRAPDVPPDLERVVMRCLAKNPSERFQSVGEVDRALAACQDAGRWSRDAARAWWTSWRRESVRMKTG